MQQKLVSFLKNFTIFKSLFFIYATNKKTPKFTSGNTATGKSRRAIGSNGTVQSPTYVPRKLRELERNNRLLPFVGGAARRSGYVLTRLVSFRGKRNRRVSCPCLLFFLRSRRLSLVSLEFPGREGRLRIVRGPASRSADVIWPPEAQVGSMSFVV